MFSRILSLGLRSQFVPEVRCWLLRSTETPIVLSLKSQFTDSFRSNRHVSNSSVDSKTNVTAKTERSAKVSVEKDLFFTNNESDVFGTLSPTQPFTGESNEIVSESDLKEQEYLENKPLRSQQLSTKQYADLIKKHLRHKQLKEAIDVVEVRMIKEDRVKPENYIFNLLIGECGRVGYSKKAFQLYNEMKRRQLKITGGTYTALFNACANSPFPKDSLERANNLRKLMFQSGFEANESTYNAMIKAYGRCGEIQTAFELVDEMKEKKLMLKVNTLNFLLQACATDKEMGFRHALLVWQKIHRRNLVPDIYSFNLMLRCVLDCGIGDVKTMRSVIATLLAKSNSDQKVKIKASQNALVVAEQKPTAIERNADGTADEIEANSEMTITQNATEEVSDQTPNLLSKNPHLGSLVSLKEVTEPHERLLLLGGVQGFLQEMELANVKPDIKTFTKILEVIPSTQAAEHRLIAIMRKADVRTDVDFFNVLIKKRSMRKDYNGARDVLNFIQAANLEGDIVTYGVLSLGCQSREQAQDLMQLMYDRGIKMNIEILGAMLKCACVAQQINYVIEILHISKTEQIRPSAKFLEILDDFNTIAFRNIQDKNKVSRQERNEYYKFYRELGNWQKAMELDTDLKKAIKQVREHPWKQFKERQADGIEPLKNKRKRAFKKTKHAIYKLTDGRLERGGKPIPQTDEKTKTEQITE